MRGPYNIPRNYKGESKILFVFSTKAFVYTAIGGMIGVFLYYILRNFGLSVIGLGAVLVFGGGGFILGTCKIPDITKFAFTQKTGGQPIDEIILKWIKFKKKKNKIYIYKEEVHKNDQ